MPSDNVQLNSRSLTGSTKKKTPKKIKQGR